MNDDRRSELEAILATREAQGKLTLHLALELAELRILLETVITLQIRTLTAMGQGESGDLASEIGQRVEHQVSQALDNLLIRAQEHVGALTETPRPDADEPSK
jgi:hypothetical protein